MSTLLLQLPTSNASPETAFSYVLTSDGITALEQASAMASLLPEPRGPGAEVVAVVPITALSWQRVQLPPGLALTLHHANNRLRAALEGLLEERLLDDPGQLHFALAPDAQTGAEVWVAVCQRNWLSGHLQALEAAGRPATRIVPAWAPGPTSSGSPELFAIGTADAPQLVITGYGPEQGVALVPLSSATLTLATGSHLRSAPAESTTLEQPLSLKSEPAVAAVAEQCAGRPVSIITPASLLLEAARSDWDLAQMDLASSGRHRALRRAGSALEALLHAPAWRAARWGAIACIAAYLIGLNTWAWQERKAISDKQAAAQSIVTSTFPSIRVVVDAPLQMQREVAQLRQANGSTSERDLEPILAQLGAALPTGLSPTSLLYSSGELKAQGISLSAEDFTAVESRLSSLGYQVRSEDSTLILRATSTP